jgi:hypothetical protein
MKRMRVFSVLIVLALLAGAAAYAENHAKAMTDDDVIAMVKAGLPDDTILSAMNGQATDFDVSATALVNLKTQGVSVKVIDAMLAASKKQHDTPSNFSAAPASGSSTSSAQSPQGEQFAPATTSAQPSGNNPQGGAQNSPAAGGASANAGGAPAQHTNFFDKLNQTQNQITGTIQQGQSNYQQVRGGMPGRQQTNAAGQATGSMPGAAGYNAQPAAPNANQSAANAAAANQAAANQAAAQARLQQQQRDLAARQAALQQQRQQQAAADQQRQQQLAERQAAAQQQRQQQLAENQKRAAKNAACREQAAKAYPKGGPDFAKAYTSCIQAP